MNKILLLFALIVGKIGYCQVPSSCVVPSQLPIVYERDIKNLTLTRMYEVHSPDTINVTFSQAWQDTIVEGMAAILNATSIPERDSVFNIYCVHDNLSWDGICITSGLLLEVDTNYAWTQAWQNLNTVTGNAFIDTVTARYGLQVTDFYNWSIGNFVVLNTNSWWNTPALIDTFEMEPGIIYGEQNSIIGASSQIFYNTLGGLRFYTFQCEFNDCFDGCDTYRRWRFRVGLDCSVTYLGSEDWDYFGNPVILPPPVNCNEFEGNTGIPEESTAFYKVYPNPAENYINIALNGGISSSEAEAWIYNPIGQPVLYINTWSDQTKIDINTLPNGLYSLVIRYEKQKMEVHKFIKK